MRDHRRQRCLHHTPAVLIFAVERAQLCRRGMCFVGRRRGQIVALAARLRRRRRQWPLLLLSSVCCKSGRATRPPLAGVCLHVSRRPAGRLAAEFRGDNLTTAVGAADRLCACKLAIVGVTCIIKPLVVASDGRRCVRLLPSRVKCLLSLPHSRNPSVGGVTRPAPPPRSCPSQLAIDPNKSAQSARSSPQARFDSWRRLLFA
jgi:hypothetical protein